MPNIPNTNQQGLILTSKGDGQNGSKWGGVGMPNQDRTYAVSGALSVASGSANYLPPFFKAVASNTTQWLVGVRCVVRAGSCVLSVTQNGAAIAGLSSISVTTTSAFTHASPYPSVSDGDSFAPVIASVSGATDGLTVTLVFAESM